MTEAGSTVATLHAVADIRVGLPDVELVTSWGDRPTYLSKAPRADG